MNKNTGNATDHTFLAQDHIILEHYGLNELNFESIKKYREMFSSVKPHHPWNVLETKEFLYKIGAWGKLRNTSKEGVTLAGLLMFSEERIITEVLPQYFLEYRESLTSIVNEGWSERFTSQDGTWSGNVYDFYFKTMHYIQANTIQIEGLHEEKLRAALHEAVINAIVHADYYGEGGIVIEKEQTQFRLANPGLMRTPLVEGGISSLRNPNMFKMFILIGLCRRAGSGLKIIESVWEQYGWSKPDLSQDSVSERTSLTLCMAPIILGQHNDGKAETEYASEEQEEVFWEITENEESVNKETNSMNNISNSVNIDHNSINKEDNSYNNVENSVNNETNSLNNALNSVNKEIDSYNKSDNSINNEQSPFMSDYEEQWGDVADEQHFDVEQEEEEELPLDEGLEAKLWSISDIARKKKRMSPKAMEEIILQLLSIKPLMLKELAHLLERTPDGLRNNYLAKLLQAGKIQLKYADQVNHPRQAYVIHK